MRSAECGVRNYIKIICWVMVALCVLFAIQLISDSRRYHGAVRAVAAGEYERAGKIFIGLDGYRDSEVLAEYCAVMAEYDAYDYASVFRSYNDLKELEIDNEELAVEVASRRAEISALYVHCGAAK